MSWAVGTDPNWDNRWIGYGVPAVCDHPGCSADIDRGLAYVCCDEKVYGGDDGCGLFFCFDHRSGGPCERCADGLPPLEPKPDTAEWVTHILTDESWQQWRDDNHDEVTRLTRLGR
jgi:hypothetical protein